MSLERPPKRRGRKFRDDATDEPEWTTAVFAPDPDADLALIFDIADLMHYLETFWRARGSTDRSRLDRLFGFPCIPEWHERALEGDAMQAALRQHMSAHGTYIRSLPKASREVYSRNRDRARHKYQELEDACAAVWYPVYGYGVAVGWSSCRSRLWGDLWSVKALPPGYAVTTAPA